MVRVMVKIGVKVRVRVRHKVIFHSKLKRNNCKIPAPLPIFGIPTASSDTSTLGSFVVHSFSFAFLLRVIETYLDTDLDCECDHVW